MTNYLHRLSIYQWSMIFLMVFSICVKNLLAFIICLASFILGHFEGLHKFEKKQVEDEN